MLRQIAEHFSWGNFAILEKNSGVKGATMLQQIRQRAKQLKSELFVLFHAYRDPRVPLHAKLFVMAVVAYAFSPIDLVPDFIPVLGYLDDLILVPLGIILAMRMIPAEVLEDCRAKAVQTKLSGKPRNWIAGTLIILIWIGCAIWLGSILYHWYR